MNRALTCLVIAVVSLGCIVAVADGVLAGYALGLLLCIGFCAGGCGLGLLQAWREDREDRSAR